MTADTGQKVRMISESEWKDYYRYDNSKFALARYETGDMATPPHECEFPEEPSADGLQPVSV